MDLELEISRLRKELGAVQGQLNSLRKQVVEKEAEITQLKSTVDVLVDPNLGPFGPMGANALHMFEGSS